MKRRKRICYTDTQKALMWDRWQQGESLHQIAPLIDRHDSSVRNFLAEHDGIRPPLRRRSPRVLTLAEREEVFRGLAAGRSIRTIAALLGRAPSTISREIGRNEGREGYRASQADHAAWDRAQRPLTERHSSIYLAELNRLTSALAGSQHTRCRQAPGPAGAQ